MGDFQIKKKTSNVSFEYANDTMTVQGEYVNNDKDGLLNSLKGSCYRKNGNGSIGEFFGNFNGLVREGKVKYSVSEMSREDAAIVWAAIDEIEPMITGSSDGGEETAAE